MTPAARVAADIDAMLLLVFMDHTPIPGYRGSCLLNSDDARQSVAAGVSWNKRSGSLRQLLRRALERELENQNAGAITATANTA
jgi:hypothetical protein